MLQNIIIGMLGAGVGIWLVGVWHMSTIGERAVGGFDLYSLMIAILGATILLSTVKVLRRA